MDAIYVSLVLTMNIVQSDAVVELLFFLVCEVAKTVPYGNSAAQTSTTTRPGSNLHCEELWVFKNQMSSLTTRGAFRYTLL